MADNSFDLSVIISAVDRFTAPVRRMSDALDNLTAPARRLGASFRNLGEAAGLDRVMGSVGNLRNRVAGLGQVVTETAGKFALLAGGAAFAFNSLFIQPAAQFERFEAVLTTVEGSSQKAKESMEWVSEFAAATPYELDQVMDAFVRLRARGFDPTNGLLETLGDTAAAMGKDVNDAVEAIADAVTGENERLKEFGITARTEGDKVTYAYTVAGKQMTASVNKNNREMIQKTLAMIWNEQYGGAMDKMSTTWIGMMSNLSDQWTRFVTMVMGSGAFDWLKNELEGLLNLVNQMAEDGRLQVWAQKLSDAFVTAFEGIKTAIPVVVDGLREFADTVTWFVDLVGGWKNALIGVAAFLAAPFIASLVSVGQALVQLGWVLMTTPVGWFLAAVAAIAGAAYLIVRNWDGITEWWSALWQQVTDAFDRGFIQGIWQALLTFNPLNLIMEAINGIIVWLGGPNLLAMLNEAGESMIDAIWDGMVSGWESLRGWFGGVVSGLVDIVVGTFSSWLDAGRQLITSMRDGIVGAWESMTGWLRGISMALVDIIVGLASAWMDAGALVISSLRDGIARAWESLPGWVREIGQGLVSIISGLASAFVDAGKAIVGGIRDGIASAWSGLTSWFRSKIDGLLQYVPDWMVPGSDAANQPPQIDPPTRSSGDSELVLPPGGSSGADQLAQNQGAIGLARQQAATATGQTLQSNSRVRVEFDNAPQGTRVSTESDDRAEIDTSMGWAMAGP